MRTPGAKPAAKKKPAAKRRGPPKWVATWAPPESGVTYRWGSWTFVLVDSRQDVVFWNDGAHMAFEFVAMSNGWWHLLTGGKEYVIWSAGGGSPQALYAKPWTEPLPAKVVEVRSGQRFEICRGGHGTTLAFDDDALRVTFYDKRVLTIPSDNEAIEFDGGRSERIYGQSV